MSNTYILDDAGNPQSCDLLTWARWFGDGKARKVVVDERDDVRISTVFLGLDHSFGGGVPILWETMIFGGAHDEYQERYTSCADALAGHARAVTLAFPPTEAE